MPAPKNDPASERTAREEHRWPAVVALLVALTLYATLPSAFLPGVRWVVVGIGLALLIPVILLNPLRLKRQTKWSRRLSVGQALLLAAANQVALVQLVFLLIGADKNDGPTLLLAALQVWITNVIAFALIYWEMDRGGPVTRTRALRKDLPAADFRFPQDEDHDAIQEVAMRSSATSDWTASFIDYLYFSASNSQAFSPTDAMPLSARAKALMGIESFAGFIILALVIARAVSLIS
jgi:heme/copper-type cytochrome/quinol oxidase subunit 4